MSVIGFILLDLLFIVLSVMFIKNSYTGPKDNRTADIDFWLFPLLVFVSVIACEALTVFSSPFRGQIASAVLTGISVLAGISIIFLIRTDLHLAEIEANIQKDDEILGWVCILAILLYLCQIAALVLHIIHLYIPQINFLFNLWIS